MRKLPLLTGLIFSMPTLTKEKRSALIDLLSQFDFSKLTPDQIQHSRDEMKVLVLLSMDHDDDENAVKLVNLLANNPLPKTH